MPKYLTLKILKNALATYQLSIGVFLIRNRAVGDSQKAKGVLMREPNMEFNIFHIIQPLILNFRNILFYAIF
jgi:hypothetical protein